RRVLASFARKRKPRKACRASPLLICVPMRRWTCSVSSLEGHVSARFCADQKPETSHRTSHITEEGKSAIYSELTSVIEQYIEAGEMTDPRHRSKYLAPKVFYFGHALTRQQAERQIISLYRRWPTRKYGP